MKERYERNIPAVSAAEQELLSRKRVLVIGCGGLGGYIIEYLVRAGVGELTVVDGDTFEASNLNRQILSSPHLFGTNKALAAAERIAWINPDTRVNPVPAFFDETNAVSLIRGHDLVVDALDNVPARLLLEDVCEAENITIVHGAIQGWSMQASVILPGMRSLHRFYGSEGAYPSKTSLSFTPPFCAAVEAAEAVKLLVGKPSSLAGKFLLADMLSMEWRIIPLFEE